MKRSGKTEADKVWLRKLGRHIDKLIRDRGYNSAYDFWLNSGASDKFSRASINNILVGRYDVKASSLRDMAIVLGIKPALLLDFE